VVGYGRVWDGTGHGGLRRDEQERRKRGEREEKQRDKETHTLPAVPSPLPTPVMSARRRGVSYRIAYDGALAKPLARL
jgi:hypothetical protein